MIKRFREYLRKELYLATTDSTRFLNNKVNEYRKETQSLSGRIKILEEQHDIMHNFLVEINKYLVNLSEQNK